MRIGSVRLGIFLSAFRWMEGKCMVPTVESQLLKTGWVNKDQLRTSVISRLLGFANHSPSVKTIQNELRLKKQKINSSDWFLLPWIFLGGEKKRWHLPSESAKRERRLQRSNWWISEWIRYPPGNETYPLTRHFWVDDFPRPQGVMFFIWLQC